MVNTDKVNFTSDNQSLQNFLLFDQKLVYSCVMKIVDSKFNLCLFNNVLVLHIFACYHLLKHSRNLPAHRNHERINQICYI